MKTRKLFRRFGFIGLAGGFALVVLLADAGMASAGGVRVFVSVGAPVLPHHHVARPAFVHRPFVRTHFIRPVVVQPVRPAGVLRVPSTAVTPSTSVVFTPPVPAVAPPSWFWTGSRWEWHTGGQVWIPAQWTWSGTQWVWTQGHWAR